MSKLLLEINRYFIPLQIMQSCVWQNRIAGILLMFICSGTSLLAQVQITTTPASLTVSPNETFTITVTVETSQFADGAEIHMSYDPNVIEVTNISLPQPNPLPVPIIGSEFDNSLGVINYAAGTFSAFPNSDFDLLELQFTALAEGSTDIEFSGLPSKVTFGGQNILSGAIGSTITVGITDIVPPVITLIGDEVINLSVGDVYTEQGASASDEIDGDLSLAVVIGGDTVDVNTVGTYIVTYNVVDASGNPATEVVRTVNVSQVVVNTYTITTNPASNGTISPSTTQVNHGDNIIFTITPDQGFEIEDVLINGSSVGPVATYEFTDVQATATISASFIESAFQLCIASGNDALTAFGRNFIGDPATVPPSSGSFIRTGGKAYLDYNGAISGTTTTDELKLFQKEIYGGKDIDNPPLAYEIPVPDGYYQVDLYFAEVYHPAAGGRVFDVLLEGNVILDEYDLVDPIKDGIGTNQSAIVRAYFVQVVDGNLNLQVGPATVDNGKISGICVTTTSNTNVHPIANLGNHQFEASTTVAETLNIIDTDQLNIVFNGLPSSLSYNPSTNQLEGTPETSELGDYVVNAIISDGNSAAVTAEFTITIYPSGLDLPPTIADINDVEVAEGSTVSTNIVVSDDKDIYNASIVIYDKSNGGTNSPLLPSTVIPVTDYTFTDNGGGNFTLDWNTNSGEGRSYLVEVTANDGVNLPVRKTFNINVAQPIPGNILARTFSSPLPWYKAPSDTAPVLPFTVAIEANAAQNIGYIDAGDYVEYLIDVPVPGVYDIEFFAAKGSAGTTVVTVSEENGSGYTSIGSVGVVQTEWQTYASYFTSVEISNPGIQTIRLDFNGGANIKNFEISQSAIAACNVAFRINAGGPIQGLSGGDFEEDQSLAEAGGSAATGNPSPYYKGSVDKTYGSNTPLVSNNTGYPDTVFQTERHIDGATLMNWEFPANGIYEVNILFNENWTGEANDPRVFDVEIESDLVLNDYRPSVAAGGFNIAKVETFTVEVTDGIMNIDFIKGTQNPSVKGFSICLISEPVNTPPVVSIMAPSNGDTVIRGTDVTLTGTALDAQDGDISNLIGWSSNDSRFTTTPLDGIGSAITGQFVTPGVQTLMATSTDNGLEVGTANVSVNVSGPSVVIDLPNESSVLNATDVRLEWTGTDVLYALTEHYHIFVNPPDINNIDPTTRISTASQIGQEFWDLTAEDGIVEGANTIVLVVADPTHATFENQEAKDMVNFIVTLPDTTPPVITLLDVDPLPVELGSPYFNLGASAFDETDGDLTDGIVVGGDIVDPNKIGNYIITYNVSDNAGNAAVEVTQMVTVLDGTAPVIACPTDIITSTDPDFCGVELNLVGVSAIDIGGDVTFEAIRSDGLSLTDPYSLGETTVTWTATDESGNVSDPCTQTITVNDGVGPNFGCPTNISSNSFNGNPIAVDIIAPFVFDSCSELDVTLTGTRSDGLEIGDAFPVGTTQIEWKALDNVGNITSCIQLVTVNFTASSQKNIESFAVQGQVGPEIIDASSGAVGVTVVAGTDVTSLSPTIGVSADASINPSSGTVLDFTNSVNYTVTAQNGTQKNWTVTVTIQEDNEDPEITCLGDISMSNENGQCGAVVNYIAPVGTDNATGATTILAQGLGSGAFFPVGTTTEVYTVTDASGNTASCSFTVTVLDSENPIINCPQDIVVQVEEGVSAAIVEFSTPLFGDNCPNASIQQTQGLASGSNFPLGTTINIFEVTDAAGNDQTCSFNVTIETIAPASLTVNGFTLVNADTDQDIMELTDGILINAATYASTNLAIRANTTSDVGSVSLLLSGSKTRSQTESVAPFALFGDNVSTADYIGELFPIGSYNLMATPYTGSGLSGNQGTAKTISFQFTNQNPLCSNFDSSIGTTVNPSGCSSNDGSIGINTVGFVGPLTYIWSHNANLNTGTVSGLGAGTYNVTITDANGCSEDLAVTLNGPTLPLVTLAPFADVLITDSPFALTGGSPSGGVYSGPGVDNNNFDPGIGSGTYSIVYTYEDGNGCSNSATRTISVGSPIDNASVIVVNANTDVALFALTNGLQIEKNTIGNTPLGIIYNADLNPGNVSFKLTGPINQNKSEGPSGPYSLFGDIGVDIQGQPFPIGNYTLVTSTTSGVSQTINFSIISGPPANVPPFVALAGNADNNVPFKINFSSAGSTDNDGIITGYSWNFGDGNTSSQQNPSHTYSSAGTYNVILNLTDDDNATSTKSISVTAIDPNINQPPNAVATASPNSGTAPLVVNFSSAGSSDTDGTIENYEWDFGDGATSTQSNPSHTYATQGNFVGTLTVTDDDGAVGTVSVYVTVNAPNNNAALFILNANNDSQLYTLTNGLQISKTDIGETPLGIIYNPDLNPGNVYFTLTGPINQSKSEGPSGPYSLFGDIGVDVQGTPFPVGNYTLVARPSVGETQTINFSIISGPPVNVNPIAVAIGNPDASQAFKVNFSSLGSSDGDGNIVGYSWNFGDGATSTAQNPSHDYSSGGAKMVTLTVTDNEGGIGTTSIQVTAIDPADIDKVVSFTLIDADNQFDLFDIQNNMNVNDGDGVNIRANTDPGIVGSVKFELSGTLTRTWIESASPYALYGDLNGEYNPTLLPVGSYTLKGTPYGLSGASGKVGQSLTINFNVVQSGSTAKMSVASMNIFPNPANESVTVSFDEPIPLTQIYVYDITGKLVKFLKMDANENVGTYLLGVQDLPTGSYFIRTIDAEGKELQQQLAIKR
ncbi:hypothetical protein DHC50_16325 [Arenibacter sp. A80]|nr:hypothetical protein [Arenibacter sp. A80]RFT55027.1 HYR domain-containing protein [Arenibacter sp. P308M17]